MTERLDAPDRPVIITPEPEKQKAARIRDLQQSIANAALGHAYAIYDARAKAAIAAAPPPEGMGAVAVRTIRHGCPNCLGFGLKYELDEQKFTITIRECYCVKYEVHYGKPSEPLEYTTVQRGKT